jgi:4'-phosphopantetheinyl transferase
VIEADAFEPWRRGERLAPLADELHLWAFRVDVASEDDWARLNDDERSRCERIRVEGKKVQRASSRSALRLLLGAYVDRAPEALEFDYGEHEKPVLRGEPIAFNLSHSGDWAIVGVASSGVIGVDVEKAEREREFMLISERFFSQVEREYLAALAAKERGPAFYRAWTRKEAYLKAWGTGLSFASSRFSIDYAAGQAGRVLDTEMPGDDPSRWHFVDLRVAPDYPAAVCCDLSPSRVRCYRLERP